METKKHLVFWQIIASPHMAGLAKAMAARGWIVHFVANEAVSAERARQGWSLPNLGNTNLHLLENSDSDLLPLLASFPSEAIHICQGIRANGYISKVLSWLQKRKRTVYVVMETVNDSGLKGAIKRLIYRALFAYHKNVSGFLAIGYRTPEWIFKRGVNKEKIYEFAYFLPVLKSEERERAATHSDDFSTKKLKFVFIGQIDGRKRLDLLLNALSRIASDSYELEVIGSGELEEAMKDYARSLGVTNIVWCGVIPMCEIPTVLSQADCLVLPSTHDGWGAVVSEALLSGCRVICSDACGSSGVAKASNVGQIFSSGSVSELLGALQHSIGKGPVSVNERMHTRIWAELSISTIPGSTYLEEILFANEATQVISPWSRFAVPGGLK